MPTSTLSRSKPSKNNVVSLAPAAPRDATTSSLIIHFPSLGGIKLTAYDGGLVSLDFLEDASASKPLAINQQLARASKAAATHLTAAADWLRSYDASGIPGPLPTLAPRGTAFQREVWEALSNLSVGQILSYRELGLLLGRPNAARCVGGAVGRNPLPVMIPCHRVLAADRRLGGYSGGLERKRSLLRHEGLGWFEASK